MIEVINFTDEQLNLMISDNESWDCLADYSSQLASLICGQEFASVTETNERKFENQNSEFMQAKKQIEDLYFEGESISDDSRIIDAMNLLRIGGGIDKREQKLLSRCVKLIKNI